MPDGRHISCVLTTFSFIVHSCINKGHKLLRYKHVLFLLAYIIIATVLFTKIRFIICDSNQTPTFSVPRISTDYDDVDIDNLLETGKRRNHSDVVELASNQNLSTCSRLPPTLAGILVADTALISYNHLVRSYEHLQRIGRFSPRDCRARQRLAVIIPFRNRWTHLFVFLNNLIPFLTRQQADVTFFVIDQVPMVDQNKAIKSPGSKFNRGALLNIGFLEAMKLGLFDCFIFHDVDLVPLNDRNLYRCGDNPRHFSVAVNKFSYRLLYAEHFGGVVGLSTQQYIGVNGHSNLYTGWGGEDDDLYQRVMNKGYFISRYSLDVSKYDMITHGKDKENHPNPYRDKLLRLARLRQEVEGLKTARYHATIRDMVLFKLVTVAVENELMVQAAPDYVQSIFKSSTEDKIHIEPLSQ